MTNTPNTGKTSRHWPFTSYNVDHWLNDDFFKSLIPLFQNQGSKTDPPLLQIQRPKTGPRYLVFQLERGEKSGKLHIQGYLELNNGYRFNYIKKLFNDDTMHCEMLEKNSSRSAARAYCMKEHTRVSGPWELGTWIEKGQGHRSDLKVVADLVLQKVPIPTIAQQLPEEFIKYHRGIERLAQVTNSEIRRSERTVGIINFGSCHTGKTHDALNSTNIDDIYTLRRPNGSSAVYWDGYSGQKCVIIDDFYGWLPFDELLRLLDLSPLRVNIKGTSAEFLATKIYFTSNNHPYTWYKNINPEPWKAFETRINLYGQCWKFSGFYDPKLPHEEAIKGVTKTRVNLHKHTESDTTTQHNSSVQSLADFI